MRETVTSNVNVGNTGAGAPEDISELLPSLVLRSLQSSMRLDANLGVDAIDYHHHTDPDRILPRGSLDALFQDRSDHLYLDAGARAEQAQTNLFLATPLGAPTFNTFTTANYRLSPYYETVLPGGSMFVARFDASLNRATGTMASTVESNLLQGFVDWETLPRPWGWGLTLESSSTRFLSQPALAPREDALHLVSKERVDSQWEFDLRSGVEQENFLRDTGARGIYGGGVHWTPSTLTRADLLVEHRFYGVQWNAGAALTSPRFALRLSGGRAVLTSAQSAFALSAPGHELAALLESMLQSSVPDPVERARLVQTELAQQNLPADLISVAPTYNLLPMLDTNYGLQATWLGHRDAMALGLFDNRIQIPNLAWNSAVALTGANSENEQRGAQWTLTRRLDPASTLRADLRWSVINGLGVQTGSRTQQEAVQLQLQRFLSPRTQWTAAVRMAQVGSSAASGGREKAAVLALSHQF